MFIVIFYDKFIIYGQYKYMEEIVKTEKIKKTMPEKRYFYEIKLNTV